MRSRVSLAAILSLAVTPALLAVLPARAEVEASATRLTIGGAPARFYMTYGHAEEPELYAPVVQELRRLQITLQPSGNRYLVFHKGVRVATCSVITSREDVPETGEEPVVLSIGGQLYVPVRAISELCGVNVKWDRKSNLIALMPDLSRPKPPVAVQPRNPQPNVPDAPLSVTTLTGVEVEARGDTLQVRVSANGPVVATWQTIKVLPVRLTLDFPNARWAPNVQLPAPSGPVLAMRTGHPVPGTARLVFEVPSTAFKITQFTVGKDEVLASVGTGRGAVASIGAPRQPAKPVYTAAQQAQIQAIKRRGGTSMRIASRGGALDVTPPDIARPQLPDNFPNFTPARSLSGKVIVVDAGHGGHSKGAAGTSYLEKDLCLRMALQFQESLQQRGARVIMTRDADVYVSLEGRCAIANAANADLFISIHCNSTPTRNSASGTETYWYTDGGSKRLAQALHRRVVGTVGGADRGVRQRGFFVIRRTSMPSVLLEIGFINHTGDEGILADQQFQNNLGENLAQGVLDYFGKDVAKND